MIIAILVSLAFALQIATADSWTNGSSPSLLVACIWYLASALNVFALGRSLSKIGFRWCMATIWPKEYATYARWGMEKEVANWAQEWLFGPMVLPLVVVSSVTCFITAVAMAPVFTEAIGVLDTPGYLIPFWLTTFLVAAAWVYQELAALDHKRKELEGLRQVYKRLPVSELLSVYECLSVAPPAFWDEYKKLPDPMVNEATNRKFRERAAPYRGNKDQALRRWAFIITAVACLATVGALIVASIDVGVMQWLIDELSK